MARRPSPTLTDGELRLMNVLWKADRATVAEVVAELPHENPVAYNTVQTMLRILEGKSYVTHEQVGRAFVYSPLVRRRAARHRALSHLMSALFDNSPAQLVLEVLSNEHLDPEETQRLKRLVENA